MPRKRKGGGKKIAIGAMVVQVNESIDGSGDNYEVLTGDQVSVMPFFPRCRGKSSFQSFTLFIWDTFEDTNGSRLSTYVNMWVMTLIVLSAIVGACIETNAPIHKEQEDLWFGIESFFIANFSVEFLLRVLTTPSCKEFWSQGMNYIDFVAILPFYLKFVMSGGGNVGFLRVLRLGRAFRLVKMGRYSQGIRLVTNALAKSVDALQLFCFLLVLVLVVFSSGIYYFERGTWDEAEGKYYRDDPITGVRESDQSPFQSIPQSFWWCIVTLTTVGYGDMFPYTDLGKVFAVITMLVGLVMLALPLSIIGTNFIEERAIMNAENEYEEKDTVNPACIITDLIYCLEQAKALKAAAAGMQDRVQQVSTLMEQVKLQQPAQSKLVTPNPLLDKEDKDDVSVQLSDMRSSYSISAPQVDQLLQLQLQLLADCIIQKDVWTEEANGLDELPEKLRTLLVPLLEGQIS